TISATIFLNRNTVINTQRANWQVQTQTKADIGRRMITSIKVVGIDVQDADVVKGRAANVLNNREAKLRRSAGHRLAAQWLPAFVSGPDISKGETAQIVGAAEVQAIINWHRRNQDIRRSNFFCWNRG